LGPDDKNWIRFGEDRKFAEKLREADSKGLHLDAGGGVATFYRELMADAELLHEELRLRIGLTRSRIGLSRRYAAGCEAFHATRLREECKANSHTAETILTLDLARALFDAGLNPVIDGTVSGLRPDLLDTKVSSLFYVEAKQYNSRTPRSMIQKAYKQVWSTWARLRKQYPAAHEAFLVVFRLGGARAELPEVLTSEGFKLYSVLVDISSLAGSREKLQPLQLTEAELLPTTDESSASS
jgi:hypothetical protein